MDINPQTLLSIGFEERERLTGEKYFILDKKFVVEHFRGGWYFKRLGRQKHRLLSLEDIVCQAYQDGFVQGQMDVKKELRNLLGV